MGVVPSPSVATDAVMKGKVRIQVSRLEALLHGPSDEVEYQKVVKGFEQLGEIVQVQKLLGVLYVESSDKDKIVVLYAFKELGVEGAVEVLPLIARDFAAAWKKHPNEMSFAAFGALERFQGMAWSKLPPVCGQNRGQVQAARETKIPARISIDGIVTTGSWSDRVAIQRSILHHQLQKRHAEAELDYVIPSAADTDWIRIIGRVAFVRLRGPSSGENFIFVRSGDVEWSFLTGTGGWVS